MSSTARRPCPASSFTRYLERTPMAAFVSSSIR